MATDNDIEDVWDDEDPDLAEVEADETPVVRLKLTIGKKQETLRIDKYLMHHVEGATRNKIQQALEQGFITRLKRMKIASRPVRVKGHFLDCSRFRLHIGWKSTGPRV